MRSILSALIVPDFARSAHAASCAGLIISRQPANQVACSGNPVTFTAVAGRTSSGNAIHSQRWNHGISLSNAKTNTLTIENQRTELL